MGLMTRSLKILLNPGWVTKRLFVQKKHVRGYDVRFGCSAEVK